MTLTLDKIVDDINDVDENDFYNLGKINITLNLVDSNNNSKAVTITSNPNTADNIMVYVCLLVLSVVGLIFGTIMIRKNKKLFGFLLIIGLSFVSLYTYASQKYNINLIFESNNIRIKVDTFNIILNDGNGNNSIKMISNQDYVLDLEEPSKKGYIFKGWSAEANGKVEYKNGDVINSDKDLDFYPVFEIINYSITYNTNGADEVNLPSSYTVEDDILLPNLTKKGYTFTGWTEGNSDTPELNLKIDKGTIGEKVFNANFTKDTYTLTYDTADGTNDSIHTVTYDVDTEDFSIPNPSKDGYTFAGWYDDSNVNHGTDLTIPKGSVGNLNLTAKYNLIQYNVELNIGTGVIKDTYNVENKINLQDPSRNGYIFKGWTYTNGGTTPDITENPTTLDISKAEQNIIKLYAIWEPVTISINNVDLSDFVAGNKINLSATVSPSYLSNQVQWSSSNNSIATISNGQVTGKAEGSVVITASVAGTSASKTVPVKKAIAYVPNTGIYYSSLQKGINAISATASTDQAKTVQLLANTTESIGVNNNRNVIVEFQNHTLNGGFIVDTNCYANVKSGTISTSQGVAFWVHGNAEANNMTFNGDWGILASYDADSAGNQLKDSNGNFLTGDAYESARANRATVRANNCAINGNGFDNEVRFDSTIYLTNCSVIGTGVDYQVPNYNTTYAINNKAGRIYVNGVLHDN